jgi:hypothetical protein
MEEIELNFRLDEHGRTTRPPSDNKSHEKTPSDAAPFVDYASKAIMTNLAPPASSSDQHQTWIDDLLFDCQISDSGLMPRTFWVPAQGMKPRCHLEQMAHDIFHHHVPEGYDYDPETSGAEWWAQIRPSPEKTGRYSMHDDQPDELSTTGISFHWDKDEDLRLLTGGTTYIHPHISTVTYLTDIGAPTLVTNHRVHSLTGEWISPDRVEGFVSWPRTGKHMSFDGRFLHAAPADLMEPGLWEKQLRLPPRSPCEEGTTKQQENALKRRHRRVTFLVNIWLNYKPFDIKPFPSSMIDKMSGTNGTETNTFAFRNDMGVKMTEDIQVSQSDPKWEFSIHKFTWPMGDCDSNEFIDAQIPLETIRKQALQGGNSRICWAVNDIQGFGVRLYVKSSEKRKPDEENDDIKECPKRSKGDDSKIIS